MSPILDSTQAAADTLSQGRAISSKASDRILLQADDERRFLVVVLNPEDKRHELVAYYAERSEEVLGQVIVSSAKDGYKVDAIRAAKYDHYVQVDDCFKLLRSMLGAGTYETLEHAIQHTQPNFQHPHFIGLNYNSPVYAHQPSGMQKFQWVGGELSRYLLSILGKYEMPSYGYLHGMHQAVLRLRQR